MICTYTVRLIQLQFKLLQTDSIVQKEKIKVITFLKIQPKFCFWYWKRNENKVAKEYCWAITQDNAGGAVMLRPIRFQSESWFQLDPHFYTYIIDHIYIYIYILKSDLHEIRLATDLPEWNNCVSRGVSYIYTYTYVLYMEISTITSIKRETLLYLR
jgi:hypothetical protein